MAGQSKSSQKPRKTKKSYSVNSEGKKIKNTPNSGGGKVKLNELQKVLMSGGAFARTKPLGSGGSAFKGSRKQRPSKFYKSLTTDQ